MTRACHVNHAGRSDSKIAVLVAVAVPATLHDSRNCTFPEFCCYISVIGAFPPGLATKHS
jgi:hypothetical protein